jgi:ubiquinone biosynthesis protein
VYYTRLGKHTVNAVRLAEILQVMVKHGFADLLRRAGFHDGLPARVLRGLNLYAPGGEPATFGQRLRSALTELGPTFVKLGQVLSTRPDLVGSDIAQEFSKLQDQVEPVPYDKMAEVIQEALGQPVETLFATFDREPVASASLSQVYRATLKTGERVAVKVQRPRIEKVIESDLSLMQQLAEWLTDRMEEPGLIDPPGIVDEFARSIRRELDFSIEARVIQQFRHYLGKNPKVFIPNTYPAFCTRSILTMDWVDGVRVDRFEEYEARNCDRSAIARTGCEVLCEMVCEHRLFHADPHPGNIFIVRDNQLAFLDLGMAGHLERADVAELSDLFLAIFHQDAEECVAAVLNLTNGEPPDDSSALEHEIADFIAFEAQGIIGGGLVAHGIERAVDILRRHHLELAPRFSMLVKALATIETVGRTLDPGLDFVTILQPYLERFVMSRYQPQYVLREAQQNAGAYLKLGQRLPDDLLHLLKQLRRGRLRFQIHHEHLENLAATIDRSSNRSAISMIVAALIVGSSLLIATDSPLSRLGVAGFIFAGLLGMALVISILWSRKY